MAKFTFATPRPYLDGFKDDTIGENPVVLEAIPQNCPIYMVQTKKGRTGVQFTVGQPMTSHYGSESFVETSKFYSHQTAMLMTTAGEGNLVAIKRLVADDAEAPVIVAGLEVVENENPVWETLENGSYRVDINGNRVDTGLTQLGHLVRLVRLEGVDMYNFDKQVVIDGAFTGNTGKTSKIYPIFGFKGEIGDDGNNVGFRISQENALSAQPSSLFTQEDQEAILYRFSWMRRTKPGASPYIIRSLKQADSIDFAFKAGVVNTKTNENFDYRRIQTEYEDTTEGTIPRFGPVEGVHFYEESIAAVQELLFATEAAATGSYITAKEQVNLFGELDHLGRTYKTIQLADMNDKSLHIDGVAVNYLEGGLDGTVSEAKLDELALNFLQGDWDNPDEPLNSWAEYPFSGFHDSGFELDTKYAILDTMGRRDDITVDVCTFIASQPRHDQATELNIGMALQARGLLTPESIIHGTQACRFSIWGGEGIQANSIYRRRCSTFLDVAAKYAGFAGAASGFLEPSEDYSDRSRNSVSKVVGMTRLYKPEDLENLYWQYGINFPVKRSTSDAFWAAYQTGYEEDTSVLNGTMYVKILTYLKRLARYHWSINTGAVGMTDEQFIDRSDQDWADLIEGRFAGKMQVTGKTVITPDDSARGFSWALDINASADPMRTVGQYNITVSRLS